MPQYGIFVYAPAPEDPAAITPELLAELEAYPDKVTELGGTIDIGFAFQPSELAKSIRDDEVTDGRFLQADEVAVGFFVLSAPDLDTAVAIAKLNPSTKGGGVEVRELFGPPVE